MGAGIPLLVAVFAIPYLLKTLGAEAFAVLTLIWALIGYFSLFDFGVGRALTYELSRRKSKEVNEIAPTLKGGIALTCAAGAIGTLLVFLLAKPLSSSWLNIGTKWQEDALFAFWIAAMGIIPTTITSGLRGALEGLDQFSTSNINRVILGSLMFGLPMWSVHFHGNHLWIAALYMVGTRFLLMFALFYRLRHYLLSRTRLELTHVAPLLNFGVWATVTGLIGPLMIFGDRFFVSAAVGVELLPLYAIPQEGLQRLLLIPAAICGALLPRFAALSTNQLMDVYHKNFSLVAWTMLGVCLVVASCSYPLLSFWISQEFASKTLSITIVLTLGIWFNAITMVPYTLIHALGRPKITAIFHLIELILYMFALWILTRFFGLLGAAFAWTGRVMLDFVLLKMTAKRMLYEAR